MIVDVFTIKQLFRSPSPSAFFEPTNLMDQEDQNDQDDAEGEEEEEEEEKVTVKEASPPPVAPIIVAPVTVPTPAPVEHPPIVLRISKVGK